MRVKDLINDDDKIVRYRYSRNDKVLSVTVYENYFTTLVESNRRAFRGFHIEDLPDMLAKLNKSAYRLETIIYK